MTAKEWKIKNPNLEVLNAEMIEQGMHQQERLEQLNKIASKQLLILYANNNIKKIEVKK